MYLNWAVTEVWKAGAATPYSSKAAARVAVWRCNPHIANCSHLFVLDTCLLHVFLWYFSSSICSLLIIEKQKLSTDPTDSRDHCIILENANSFRPSIEFQGTTCLSMLLWNISNSGCDRIYSLVDNPKSRYSPTFWPQSSYIGFAGMVTAVAAYTIFGSDVLPAQADPTGGE